MSTENIATPSPGEKRPKTQTAIRQVLWSSEVRPKKFSECSREYGGSESWWRAQAAAGAVRTIQFGRCRAVPAAELDRIAREGLPPLVLKGKKSA
jgi:hypothetical protein